MEGIFCPHWKRLLSLFSDALKEDWGAHLGSLKIGGQWFWEEKLFHINLLEMKAAFLAFLPHTDKPDVQLNIDKRTAVAYINHLEGVHSEQRSLMAIEMWNYMINRNMSISAVHVPLKANKWADKK